MSPSLRFSRHIFLALWNVGQVILQYMLPLFSILASLQIHIGVHIHSGSLISNHSLLIYSSCTGHEKLTMTGEINPAARGLAERHPRGLCHILHHLRNLVNGGHCADANGVEVEVIKLRIGAAIALDHLRLTLQCWLVQQPQHSHPSHPPFGFCILLPFTEFSV